MKKILTILLCCVSVAVSAQVRTIQGTVTSGADGSPVGGVVVTVAGSNASALTDAQGAYSIKASTGDVLAFQLLGFDRTEIAVGVANVLDVVLTPQLTEIDELVVIGYGTQQKKLITGATVQVDGDDIAKLNTVNVMGALQSQTPGVNIIQNNGSPGEGYKINIRGLGTVGNSTPLFVIDGTPGGDINTLNPSDIESIDVLKDAASAAIYGSRAANGVILVTTKHGKAGQKAQVAFDAYYGIQNVYRMPQMLNAKEYMTIIDEANVMDGKAPIDWATKAYGDDPENHYQQIMDGKWNGTDWMGEILNKNAPIQNYAVNITGGTSEGTYAMGFSYTNQEGALGNPVPPRYERYTGRINSQYTIVKGRSFDILKVGENLTYTHYLRPGAFTMDGSIYSNDIYNVQKTSPLLPMYDETGDWHYAIPFASGEGNPIAGLVNNKQSVGRNHALRTNVFLDFQPIKNLVFRSNFGYRLDAWAGHSFTPTWDLHNANNGKRTYESVRQYAGMSASLSWENTLNYTFKIADDHNFTALLGQSVEKSGGLLGEELSAWSSSPQFSGLKYAYLDNAPYSEGLDNKGYSGKPMAMDQLASFFGRVSYDYQNKYMMTVVLRADGSSNFARGHRWGYFPSVSAGWIMTEENFMEGTKSWMDFLKIRASWGQNGNQSIDNFQYMAPISSDDRYVFGTDKANPVLGYFPSTLANPDVSWETSEQIDLGIDASFFRNRLSVTADYFIKNTKNWLVRAPLLASYGTGAPYVNGGNIRNSGVELAFAWNDRVGEFTYGANLNLTFIKNKVIDIANTEGIIHGETHFMWQQQDESYRAQEGFPIGYFYGYQTAGIFQNQAQIDATAAKLDGTKPGDVIWVDRNGDGVINTDDRGYLGKPNPDVRLGFGLNLGYKGFDLSMNVIGAFGNEIARSWRSWGDNAMQNYTSEIMGRWHGEGTSNRLPRVSAAPHTNTFYFSDLHIEKGDYVRIQNLTLGYNLNEVIKSGFLTQARVYVTAQNLLTITGYSGMDPEVGTGGSKNNDWTSGIDVGYYPNPRTFLLGINLKF